ncbi:glycoside hydrolase [Sodiomyces alkalinus F11]|uniref:lytic cellulose monooxygenase (C4-dehydrogenating) n=1 Tax=Sodiomyces alkalinus (strain CBS 110278 / VKM F-3762 / F11) TaxID=1314773 RepID=A0A3N2Q3N2_SODAK|nr:glycoside hydrolase [Sodiomyces alkalinus F11]ROT41278.1 glycoside hydrolase [Sodiomyces alkalinus F11]
MFKSLALTAGLLASQAAAHGYLSTVTLDGTTHQAYNPGQPTSSGIGWSFTATDEGPVKDIYHPDLVCRQDAHPTHNHGPVSRGGTVSFHWTSDDKQLNPYGWAPSHKGPIMTYIAPCPHGDCVNLDKSALRWTKIDHKGLVAGPASDAGYWATDALRDNGGVDTISLPASIAPGNYVLRHELVALHKAHEWEPEFYPQCVNIRITGQPGGDDLGASGVPARELYRHGDPALYGFDLHREGAEAYYNVPGPWVYGQGH